ncbi:histidine utilization repressor [Paralcaligenes sp. KSB-10]|uniref:histidine utilization repressor n=1 Tax=Paralcaligenes sp. KSB-10 TaxID=2901142 RepID=UPI001E4961CB|nr:histidine utilization repressor [Paralcaligenes sp. KSB-10]UHL63723.1 histidine utilization repressor [Paralcaligenes sp. KSB-10]
MRHKRPVPELKPGDVQPAYQQIKNYVLEQIQNGVWKEGDLIPTELALCETFNVSRMTVNRALRELTTDQLLVRYKGSGTFVAQPKFQSTLIEIRSIAQDIRDRGHRHSSKVLQLESLPANDIQARRFQIAPETKLFRSVIVHYENDIAIQIEDRLVDSSVAPDYLEQNWETQTPNEYLMRVAPLPSGQYTIEVRLPTKEIAAPLDIPVSQPCLVMDRITFSNRAFTSNATMWHPGNRYKFAGKY